MRTVYATLLLMTSLAMADEPTASAADLDREQTFSIEAQPLDAALLDFSDQANVQVMVAANSVEGLETDGVEGRYTPRKALTALLDDSDLAFTEVGNTIAVTASEQRGDSDPKNLTMQPLMLAQNTGSRAPAATARLESDESDRGREASERDDGLDVRGQIETIVVVGSRNAGIRRYEDDAQPYVVFDTVEIENSFAVNLEDFLRARLPQNVSLLPDSLEQINGSNQSEINLRGLGSDQTLILVNGRRLPSRPNTLLGQADINGIPLSAVERIEVLPATASGIYGGGATGGAINIVLRRDYVGATLDFDYANTFDTDAGRRTIGGSAGFGLEGGRTSVLLTASYSDSNPLFVRDRDFAQKAQDLLFTNAPEEIFDRSAPLRGATPNIRSRDGSELILDDGTPLGASFAFVPDGYAGAATDGGRVFLDTAGQYNLIVTDDLGGGKRALFNNPTIEYYSINVTREFTDWLDVSADYSYSRNEGRGNSSTSVFPTVNADAPNNPFQNDIRVAVPLPELEEAPVNNVSLVTQGFLGATIDLPFSISAQLEYGFGTSERDFSAFSPALTTDFDAAVRTGDIDVLRDTRSFPVGASEFLFTEPPGVSNLELDSTNITARLTGEAFELPAGRVSWAALLERQNEEFNGGESRFNFGFPLFLIVQPSEQEVDSAYFESNVPLFSSRNERTGLRSLDLQLAVRYDDYSRITPDQSTIALFAEDAPVPEVEFQRTDLSATSYTVGLRYQPVQDVILRSSFSTGFLPPSLIDLRSRVQVSATRGGTLTDPRRGNIEGTNTLPITVTSGGNPDLQPEDSESWSVGAIFEPGFLPGLRVSVDWIRIDKSDEINSLNASTLLVLEDIFPGRVTRLELTPEDEALGYTGGEITALDISLVNIAGTTVEAVDFQLSYEWDTRGMGSFEAYVVGSVATEFERQILPTLPVTEFVGFNDGPLEWRGNVGLNWERGSWFAGWNAQYYDSYRAYSGELLNDALIAQAVRRQGSATIPSQIYHDVFALYRTGQSAILGGIFSDTEVRIGIQNLFDEEPPIVTTAPEGYSTFGDPRLRRYSVQFRKNF